MQTWKYISYLPYLLTVVALRHDSFDAGLCNPAFTLRQGIIRIDVDTISSQTYL